MLTTHVCVGRNGLIKAWGLKNQLLTASKCNTRLPLVYTVETQAPSINYDLLHLGISNIRTGGRAPGRANIVALLMPSKYCRGRGIATCTSD